MRRRPPRATRTDTLFPYTTLFRSIQLGGNCLPGKGTGEGPDSQAGTDEAKPASRDLVVRDSQLPFHPRLGGVVAILGKQRLAALDRVAALLRVQRSEERRGGKEWVRTCRSRWSPDHYNKKTHQKQ